MTALSGFLKKPISNRKAKKKKSKGGKEEGEEGKEMGSDGEERRSETPTPEHGDLMEDSSTGEIILNFYKLNAKLIINLMK